MVLRSQGGARLLSAGEGAWQCAFRDRKRHRSLAISRLFEIEIETKGKLKQSQSSLLDFFRT